MKFQPDTAEGANVITRAEAGRIWVGSTLHEASIVVPWVGAVAPWSAVTPEDLRPEHFAQLALLQPEVVIFGSGARIRFVAPALLRPLYEARIGIETMDTAAACRTYNVLASERRKVVAALLMQPAPI
jgi:uncharacterized protein